MIKQRAPALPPNFATSVVAIWGMRGSGKSTLARDLIKRARLDKSTPRPQVVWIDPVGAGGCATPAQVERALISGQAEISLTSATEKHALDTIALCGARSRKWAPIYLVLDEAALYLRTLRPSISKLFLQGRHYGLGVMMISQRPVHVHPDYREQACARYWLRLDGARDRAIAADEIGRDLADGLKMLPVGRFHQDPAI